MKPSYAFSFSISCLLIILQSTSCKKDSVVVSRHFCDTCIIVSEFNLPSSTIIIGDSEWEKQNTGCYKSDITMQIQKLGATVSQVYSMYIVNGGSLLKIFPYAQANYMNFSISCNVDRSNINDARVFIFGLSNQEKHFGEIRNDGLPFTSIEIKIFYTVE